MLFATDKFTLSFGDTAKLTIQYENTTLTNTGKKQAIVEASKDGYTWAQVASIAPESSLPLKIEALYVRLTTDTTISVVNTNPIPRDAKKSDIAVNINTEALVIKDDLQAYVSKNELNDLVQHPDLSDYVTTRQLQDAIPDVPKIPDVSGLATKESVVTKAEQAAVDELKSIVATKADSTTVAGLQTQLTHTIIPSIYRLHENKADKTELTNLANQVSQSTTAAQALGAQVTGFQSELDDRITKSQAEEANHILLNAIAARASQEELDALHDVVEQKANQEQVAELINKTFHLEQDKANKVDVIELTKAVNLIQTIISGDADASLLDEITEDVLAVLPELIESLIPEDIGEEQLQALESKLTQLIQAKANTDHQHQWEDITTYQAPKPVNLITSVDTLREGGISPEYPYISYAQLHPNMHIEAGEQFTLTVWAELGSTHTGLTLVFVDQGTGNPLNTIPLIKISQGVYQYKGNLDPLIDPLATPRYNTGTFYIGYTGTQGSTTTLIKAQLTRGTQAYDYRPHPSVMAATLKDLNNPNLVPKNFMHQFMDNMDSHGQHGQLAVALHDNITTLNTYPAGRYTVTVWGKINQPLYLGVHGNSPQGLSHSTSFSYTGREYVHTEDQRFVEISPNIYAATIELPELIINSFYIEMQSLARTREWQNQYQQQQQAGTVPPNAFYFDAIQIKHEDRASDYSAQPESFFTTVIPPASSSQVGLVRVADDMQFASSTDALSAAQGRYITRQFTYRAYTSHLLGAKVMRNLYSKLTVMTLRADCTTNKVINLPEAFSDTTYFWIARGESTKGWIKGTTTSTSRITLDSTDNPDATGIINILAIGYKA